MHGAEHQRRAEAARARRRHVERHIGRSERLQPPPQPFELGGEIACEIAGLGDQSTQELRRAWRTSHHTGPPLGLSRDLIIRGVADKLQQRAHGGPSRASRLRMLAADFEKGARSFDLGGVLNFSKSITFELSTSSAFSSLAVNVTNWPR